MCLPYFVTLTNELPPLKTISFVMVKGSVNAQLLKIAAPPWPHCFLKKPQKRLIMLSHKVCAQTKCQVIEVNYVEEICLSVTYGHRESFPVARR